MVSGVRSANASRTTLERSARMRAETRAAKRRIHAGLDFARPSFDWRIKDAPLRMTPFASFDWRIKDAPLRMTHR